MDTIETIRTRVLSLLPGAGPAPVEHLQRVAFQRREAYTHHPQQPGVDPTRYGDWEYNGRCTDFS